MHASLLRVILVASLSWAAPPRAAAQPAPAPSPKERAQALLVEGNDLLSQGRYLDALAAFRRAFEAFPSPMLHFPLAQTYHELGRPLDALDHYERFVRSVTQKDSPAQWALAHQRIFALQGAIARLEIQTNVVEAEVTVDGRSVGMTPLDQPIRFLPGAHVVIVARPRYERAIIEVNLRAGEALSRRVELVLEEEAVKRRAAALLEAQRRAAQERLQRAAEAERRRQQRTRRLLRTSGWLTLGVGLTTATLGGCFGLLARSEYSAVADAGRDQLWRDVSPNYDRGETYRQVFFYGLGIGGALAIGGGVLMALGYRGERRSRAGPQPLTALPAVGTREAGVLVVGRF